MAPVLYIFSCRSVSNPSSLATPYVVLLYADSARKNKAWTHALHVHIQYGKYLVKRYRRSVVRSMKLNTGVSDFLHGGERAAGQEEEGRENNNHNNSGAVDCNKREASHTSSDVIGDLADKFTPGTTASCLEVESPIVAAEIDIKNRSRRRTVDIVRYASDIVDEEEDEDEAREENIDRDNLPEDGYASDGGDSVYSDINSDDDLPVHCKRLSMK